MGSKVPFAGFMILILALGQSLSSGGTNPGKNAAIPKHDLSKAKFFGVGSCIACHEEPKKPYTVDFVQLTEFATWSKQDKHSQAYLVLSNHLAKKMGAILRLDPLDAKAGCLSCHAMPYSKDRQGGFFKLENGVSCDGCHGPSQYWYAEHKEPEWRLLSPLEKKDYGMTDVRNPLLRTQMCLSCHIGSVAEGKILTHEMYAAGHPPLPGFEIATFSKYLPQHWRPLKDVPFFKNPVLKGANIPDKFLNPDTLKDFVHDLYQFEAADFEQTKLVLIGGILVLRESMYYLAAQADAARASEGGLDFAQFDCAACHHDLKSPSWRQKRGYAGSPGRPMAPSWPHALVKLGIKHAAGASQPKYDKLRKEYEAHLQALNGDFGARPFGEPKKVSASAKKLANWADGILVEIHNKKIDHSSARLLLEELLTLSEEERDYDSTRQIGWALRRVQDELCPEKVTKTTAPIWTSLNKELRLAIPVGKYDIEKTLPEALERLGDFDPARSLRLFWKLKKELGKVQ